MRLIAWSPLAAFALALAPLAATAAPIQQGSSILAIQLSEGTADIAVPVGGGYLARDPEALNDFGIQAQFWHFVRDEYAFNISGGIGFGSEKEESDVVGNADVTFKQPSWHLRVGGDRVAHITTRFHIFAGPGIQFWSGKLKREESGFPDIETENTNRLAIDGRIGVHLKMGESFGLIGHLGHYFGRAWSSDGDSKASWWATGHDGAGGIAFNF